MTVRTLGAGVLFGVVVLATLVSFLTLVVSALVPEIRQHTAPYFWVLYFTLVGGTTLLVICFMMGAKPRSPLATNSHNDR
jgi:hypothetical protein